MDEQLRTLQREVVTGHKSTVQLISAQLRTGLQTLSNEEFEELGKAWFTENLRRNPLPTEDDVHVAYHDAHFIECECLENCSCTADVCDDCCPGCAADQECTKCEGWGTIKKADCQLCHGCGHRFKLDVPELAAESDKFYEQENENYRKLRICASWFSEDAGVFGMVQEMQAFYEDALKQLGARVTQHPVKEWGFNVAVMMPKYPQVSTDEIIGDK